MTTVLAHPWSLAAPRVLRAARHRREPAGAPVVRPEAGPEPALPPALLPVTVDIRPLLGTDAAPRTAPAARWDPEPVLVVRPAPQPVLRRDPAPAPAPAPALEPVAPQPVVQVAVSAVPAVPAVPTPTPTPVPLPVERVAELARLAHELRTRQADREQLLRELGCADPAEVVALVTGLRADLAALLAQARRGLQVRQERLDALTR